LEHRCSFTRAIKYEEVRVRFLGTRRGQIWSSTTKLGEDNTGVDEKTSDVERSSFASFVVSGAVAAGENQAHSGTDRQKPSPQQVRYVEEGDWLYQGRSGVEGSTGIGIAT